MEKEMKCHDKTDCKMKANSLQSCQEKEMKLEIETRGNYFETNQNHVTLQK